MHGAREKIPVTPRVEEIARLTENEDSGRLDARLLFLFRDVAAVSADDVVVVIDTHARELAVDPAVGQALGPGRIDLEARVSFRGYDSNADFTRYGRHADLLRICCDA
jgi:hypothetical protein